uniref:TTF-type domain-containing protein n=1 Tax=Sphaeramia orbicularis TaxID=375764 RepID=A0A672ZBF4_9TELE
MKRSYPSGNEKRKKRKEEEEKRKQDSGSLRRFLASKGFTGPSSNPEPATSQSVSTHSTVTCTTAPSTAPSTVTCTTAPSTASSTVTCTTAPSTAPSTVTCTTAPSTAPSTVTCTTAPSTAPSTVTCTTAPSTVTCTTAPSTAPSTVTCTTAPSTASSTVTCTTAPSTVTCTTAPSTAPSTVTCTTAPSTASSTVTCTTAPSTVTCTTAPSTAPSTVTCTTAPSTASSTVTCTTAPSTVTCTTAPSTAPSTVTCTTAPSTAPSTVTCTTAPSTAPSTVTCTTAPSTASSTVTCTTAPSTVTCTTAPSTVTCTTAPSTAPSTVTYTTAPSTASSTVTCTIAPSTVTCTIAPSTAPSTVTCTTAPSTASSTVTCTIAPSTVTCTTAPSTVTSSIPVPGGSGSFSEQSASNRTNLPSDSGDQEERTPQRPTPESHHAATASSSLISDDPAQWPGVLSNSEKCSLVTRGPVQVKDVVFPQNKEKAPRRFTKENYYMVMKNGEKIQRTWLIYSVSSDSVFCFACKLFGKQDNAALTKGGFRNWKNLAGHLKDHEYSKTHINNMKSWHELQMRLKTKTAFDQINQDLLYLEEQHWKAVIHRVIAIICHLAERNQALRGRTSVLFDHRNGNFLSQVELMAKFDPVMNEHLRRIQQKETKVHYLSSQIQNEIIELVGGKIVAEIVQRVQKAKYFSIIMDCSPDTSHTQQLSIVLRIVNCEPSGGVSVAEHFVGFVDVKDTTGKGLCETLLDRLAHLNLNLADCRGQSYDNGSNMMGHKQGVQARILHLNDKAPCVPCSSHTLNLVVADAAKSSVTSMSFFGVLQRLYNLFSSSVQHWAVLQQHVKRLTVKSLSVTRWEARIDSVKVVRYNLPEIIQALSALHNTSIQKKDAETTSTVISIMKELMTWRFLLCTNIWYNVLYQVNRVSKLLQNPTGSLELLQRETCAVRQYLEQFRLNGLAGAKTDARQTAETLGIDMTFPAQRRCKTTRQFQCESREEGQSSPEEHFSREFFLPLVDTALTSLNDRFSRHEDVYNLYGFLFSKEEMCAAIQNDTLTEKCQKLEKVLQDIDSEDLVLEVRAAYHAFPEHVSSPREMLNYIYKEQLLDLYANLSIAFRLLLTLPITVASGERSFSALRLIKTYLRSTMSQERLSGLALISIERKVRRSLNLEDIVTAFAQAKSRKHHW